MKTVVFFLIALSFSIASAQEWKQLPGPTRSNARQIEVDKFGSIYALTDSNEIYRSDDNGGHWLKFRLPEQIHPNQITKLFCIKSGAIYFSASQYNKSGGTVGDSNSVGVYVSVDKGITWNKVLHKLHFVNMVSNGNNIVYGATEWRYDNRKTKYYQSLDTGFTWEEFYVFNEPCYQFDVDKSNRVYIQDVNESRITVYSSDGALIGAIDDDEIRKNEASLSVSGTFKVIGDSRFAFVSDSVFYLKTGDANWVRISTFYTHPYYTNVRPTLLIGRNNRLYIAAQSYSGTIYTHSIISSSDLGNTWTQTHSFETKNRIPPSVAIDSSQHFLYSDRLGIYRKSPTSNYTTNIGFPIATISSIVVDKNGDIHAADSGDNTYGNYYNRLLRSSDQGQSWIEEFQEFIINGNIGLSLDSGVFCINDSSLSNYTSNNLQFLFHYDPELKRWKKVTSFDNLNYAIELKSFPPSTLYIDVSRSDDNGLTWEGLYDIPPVAFVHNHSFLVAAPGKVLIGYRPAIYMTEDNGITWRKLNHHLVDRTITALYANDEGLILAGSEYGDILRSNDNGTTWTDWRGSLQGSIKRITSTVDNIIFVATTKGLFSRGLNDTDWKLELADKEIVYIGFGKDNEVFACASREGIWTDGKKHFTKPKEGVKQKGIRGISVSPNPAVSVVTAGFDMNTSGRATLSLVDELGREVLRKNELLGEGWHQVSMNVSIIPSGFYHVLLETPSGKTISKVVVCH